MLDTSQPFAEASDYPAIRSLMFSSPSWGMKDWNILGLTDVWGCYIGAIGIYSPAPYFCLCLLSPSSTSFAASSLFGDSGLHQGLGL